MFYNKSISPCTLKKLYIIARPTCSVCLVKVILGSCLNFLDFSEEEHFKIELS